MCVFYKWLIKIKPLLRDVFVHKYHSTGKNITNGNLRNEAIIIEKCVSINKKIAKA